MWQQRVQMQVPEVSFNDQRPHKQFGKVFEKSSKAKRRHVTIHYPSEMSIFYVRILYKMVGIVYRSLTNANIDNYYKHEKKYLGTLPRDMLPKRFSNKFIILNQDTSNGPGTHYNLIFPTKQCVIFFDSFGILPCPEAEQYMKKSRKPILHNKIEMQNINSVLCGYYCLFI